MVRMRRYGGFARDNKRTANNFFNFLNQSCGSGFALEPDSMILWIRIRIQGQENEEDKMQISTGTILVFIKLKRTKYGSTY
jgi:hypothetical protein